MSHAPVCTISACIASCELCVFGALCATNFWEAICENDLNISETKKGHQNDRSNIPPTIHWSSTILRGSACFSEPLLVTFEDHLFGSTLEAQLGEPMGNRKQESWRWETSWRHPFLVCIKQGWCNCTWSLVISNIIEHFKKKLWSCCQSLQ